MARVVVFVFALALALVAAWARADDGAVHLKWDDCPFEPDADIASCMPCFEAGRTMRLLGTFELEREISGVVGMELWLDWHFHALPEVPPFWRLHPDGCNSQGVTIRAVPHAGQCASASTALCGDLECRTEIVSYGFGSSIGQPENRGTLVAGVYRPESSSVTLGARPARHFGFELELEFDAGLECGGCASAGTLVWSAAVLYTPQGTVAPEGVAAVLTAGNPRSDPWSYVNMRGPLEVCSIVPVRSTSWGRLKALYR